MTENGSHEVSVKNHEAGSSQEAGMGEGLNHNAEVTPSPGKGIYDMILWL